MQKTSQNQEAISFTKCVFPYQFHQKGIQHALVCRETDQAGDTIDCQRILNPLPLELTGVAIEKIIDQLIVEDYSEGPLTGEWQRSKKIWVFGKKVKG